MAQNWNIDPKSGDYVMKGGAPEQTDSLTIPAYIRLKTQRGGWMYAPDAKYGSQFHKIAKRRTTQDATFIENLAADALAPIVEDNRANEIEVATTQSARHGIGMEAIIQDARGRVDKLNLPSI